MSRTYLLGTEFTRIPPSLGERAFHSGMTSKAEENFLRFIWRYFQMKNFPYVSFFCVGTEVLAILVIFVLSIAVPACAEPERYDFPKEGPINFVKPLMPILPDFSVEKIDDYYVEKMEAHKVNEARRKSIAALLQQYNKKLTDKESYNYAILIIQASEKFKQNPFVIAALVVSESSARHDAVSRGGDYGLMQVRWRVHEKKIRNKYPHIAKAKDILNPENNLLVGTEIFSTYRATANQDVRDALMYYSSGNKRMTDKVFALVSQLEKSYLERLSNG